jgi:hypothetical protein
MSGLAAGRFLENLAVVFSILLVEFTADFVAFHNPLILQLVQSKLVRNNNSHGFSGFGIFQDRSR